MIFRDVNLKIRDDLFMQKWWWEKTPELFSSLTLLTQQMSSLLFCVSGDDQKIIDWTLR